MGGSWVSGGVGEGEGVGGSWVSGGVSGRVRGWGVAG